MPAMSQGNRSQNIPLKTNCLSDSELEEREIMLKIAANPQTPIDLLQQLAYSSDRLIRKTVVGNPNTPREILFKLGAEFPESLINNPVWDLLFLEEPTAIGDLPIQVQQHLLLQDEVPYYLMESIATSRNLNLCLGLARHPKTPQSLLEKIVRTPNIPLDTIKLHINWPDPPQESLEEIIRASFKQRIMATTTQFTLRSLAETGFLFDLIETRENGTIGKWGRVSHALLLTQGLETIITPPHHESSENPEEHTPNLDKLLKQFADDSTSKFRQSFENSSPDSPASFKVVISRKEKSSVISDQKPGLTSNKHRLKSAIGHNMVQILDGITGSSHTPNWLLYQLAIRNSRWRRNILNRPQISSSLLENLAMTPDYLLQREVARHPNTPPSVLKLLAWVPDIEVRWHVARHPNTRSVELLILAIDKSVKIRRQIAKNPNSPMMALELLAKDPDVSVRLEVAKHPTPPLSCLEGLVNDNHYQVRNAALANSSTPIPFLKKLTEFINFQGRPRLLTHLKIPVFLLKTLVKEPDDRVQDGIDFHPHIPLLFFKQLTEDPKFLGQYRACAHPHTSVSMLRELLCDRNLYAEPCHIYRSVASNYLKQKTKSLPLVLKQLAEYSKDSFERLLVLLHPQIPPSALAKNRQSLDWLERYCIAQHPNTPLCTLEELANDGNRVVRAVAREQLKQRQPPASTASD